jgi:enoyl-[acyl-carrier protein] reductase I
MQSAKDTQGINLITGVANEQSIAWAVADRLLRTGHRCILASLPGNVRRAEKLVARAGYDARVLPLDVSADGSLEQLRSTLIEVDAVVDAVLHSIAYAELDDLEGPTLEVSRTGFLKSMDISVYSLIAIVRAVRSRLRCGSSVVALTYHGSQKCIPGYNLMGVVKAALESGCRYLANDLGGDGIRVNCVSPGALLTLSSSVFPRIDESIERAALAAPIKAPTRMEDVASVICYLMSAAAGGVTGQTVYVDNGVSIMGG